MKKNFIKNKSVLSLILMFSFILGVNMETQVLAASQYPDGNFGLPPKKEKANPTNKPLAPVSKPWELSEKQESYAEVGTAFSRRGLSEIKGKERRQAIRNFKTGLALFEEARRAEAMPFLKKAYEVNSENLLLNVLLGHTSVISTMTRYEAEPYLLKALALSPDNFEARYDLAQILVSRYELDSAISLYEQCKQLPGIDSLARQRCDSRIKECRYAKTQMKKPLRVFVDNMGASFNSSYPDYAPLVSAEENQIYFTSRRPAAVTEDMDEYTGMAFEDIYVAEKLNDSMWDVLNVGKPVNTKGHDATSGISPDQSTFFVYRGAKKEGEIYTAQFDSTGWQTPRRQEEGKSVGTKISQEQTMSFSFDGRTAYFVSNREGGFGGFDIWVTTKDDKGHWTEPKNLGPTINTAKDEISVYTLSDGKSIFFSSNGHQTMGGLDIFYAKKENDTTWSRPANLGWPINTVENDAFYWRSLSGKTAYYASERMAESQGGYDIYKITYMGEEKGVITQSEDQLLAYITKPVSESVSEAAAEITITPITLLKGYVYDDFTKKPLEADVVMVDNDLQQEIAVFRSNPITGKFMVQLPAGHDYAITVRKEGYLFHSENFNIPVVAEYQEVEKEFPLKNVSVGSRVVLRNIFFEFDKATLLPQSYVELDRLYKLLIEVPTIKIEISGHTDSKGSATYNQSLSERRAKTVVEYLVARGIGMDRLTYKGYGLTQPIATNDTEEGRALNRRTEFKIIENNMDQQGGRPGRNTRQVEVAPVAPPSPADTATVNQ